MVTFAEHFHCTHTHYRHADFDEDLSEFLNDGSWKRGYIANRWVGPVKTSVTVRDWTCTVRR